MNFIQDKIDIVYIWVDGADPIWKQKRNESYKKIQDTSILSEYANVDGRFRDNGELKYSLRSLEKYFPNHWNIYIITDNQIPSFLRKDSGIQIISHRDFISEDKLPTFSSRKIEAFIPFIESISDTFILMNDDVFLWPNFWLHDFISWNKSIHYFTSRWDIDESEYMSYSDNTSHILEQEYDRYQHIDWIPSHTPRVIDKSNYIFMTNIFASHFISLSQEVFREKSNTSFIWDLYGRWMIHNDKWINWWHEWLYISTTDKNYDTLLSQFKNLSFFCINDTSDNKDNDPGLIDMKKILEKLFPEKSHFEK